MVLRRENVRIPNQRLRKFSVTSTTTNTNSVGSWASNDNDDDSKKYRKLLVEVISVYN